jgi:glycosyltransferase involved in cell wall biosynthesis
MEVLFWVSVGIGAAWVLLFVKNLKELREVPKVSPGDYEAAQSLPMVSVIIPARNEEANIKTCVDSLIEQDIAELEIIIVDDSSEDQTVEIVNQLMENDKRIKLIHAEPLPPGWMGKCHAIYEGVRQGRPKGEWLLFVDADTIHSPQSISHSLSRAIYEKADLFSLIPHLEAKSFWERLMQPTVAALIALFNRPALVNDPKRTEIFANGQYMLVRKDAYLAAGGHEGVASRVLEDVELARNMVAAGHKNFLAVGRDLFATRMYTGLRTLIEGWSKNFYMILQSSTRRVLIAAMTALLFSIVPALTGLLAALALVYGFHFWPYSWYWIAIGIYLMVLGFQCILRGYNRWYPQYSPLAPLANIIAVFVLIRSTWINRYGQGIAWKGRVVVDDRGEGKP